jgi:signal transduction histidine kinase
MMQTASVRRITAEFFLARHALPMRVWLSRAAASRLGPPLGRELAGSAEVKVVDAGAAPGSGPAVLLLTADELAGPERQSLQEVARRALPGRPVIIGGARDRDKLLDSINVWHAHGLVPGDLPAAAVADAVRKAHETLALQTAVEGGVEELRGDCRRLESALAELRETQQRLLHSERLATIGRMTSMVVRRVEQHLESMEAFAEALRPLPKGPDVERYLEHAVESSRAIGALLHDMLALAENRDAPLFIGEQMLDPMIERTVELFRLDPVARGMKIAVDCRAGARVRVDRHRLIHVLINLLRNAAQASRRGDEILVRTAAGPEEVSISVRDRGTGISA